MLGLLSNLALEGLGPHWIRPTPPRLPVQDDEVRHKGLYFDNFEGILVYLILLVKHVSASVAQPC